MGLFKSKREREEEAEWDNIENATLEIMKHNTKKESDIKPLRKKRIKRTKAKRKSCGCK
jgi:hypothetical protein